MYLSFNWLKDFVDLPSNFGPEELAERLTMHTVEIDSVLRQAEHLAKVLVGEIKSVRPHPNADKLRLARVDAGQEKELDIVCGAPNIEAGQKVPVALIGAELPGGLKIKESLIRGEVSQGMLCAEDELGLGEDHEGILILDKKAKIGAPVAEILGQSDVLLEVDNKSITNRPDLWGHYGYAREIKAFLGVRTTKEFDRLAELKIPAAAGDGELTVKIEDHELCPRYIGVKMDGIKVAPSPEWLTKRLIAVGVRPINNIVDATNYVMYELGQPLHAFDAARVDRIVVRPARSGEKISTLDGQERELEPSDIVIADSQRPIAIAGVMGGETAEIGEQSQTVILEAANFNFLSIRQTSVRLGLRTEASQRFEKSLDPNLCYQAMARLVELIIKLCPDARLSALPADVSRFSLGQEPIRIGSGWLKRFLGQEIEADRVAKILSDLGFTVETDRDFWAVTAPSWRATKDISIKEDIAEEIARVYGYGRLDPLLPQVPIRPPRPKPGRDLERRLKNLLSGRPAMSEVYNYSFVGEDQVKKLGLDPDTYIRLLNPLASHQALLRQNLTPNMLEAVKTNQARYARIRLFEVGSVYLDLDGEMETAPDAVERLPRQEKRLCLAVAAEDGADALADLKSILGFLADSLGLECRFEATGLKPAWAEAATAAEIICQGVKIGFINRIDPKSATRIQLKKKTAVAELNLDELVPIVEAVPVKNFREFGKFPPARRDLALVADEKVSYNSLYDTIAAFHPYISAVELFDLYRGGQIGKNKKSLAFHITYQTDKTLKSEEVDAVQKELAEEMERKFGAKIRD